MVLQLGGIPDPNANTTGKLFFIFWMIVVALQWCASGAAGITNVIAYMRFEELTRECLVRSSVTGHAFFNVILPILPL